MRLFDSCPLSLSPSLFLSWLCPLSAFHLPGYICFASSHSSILVDLARSPFASPLYTTRLPVAPSLDLSMAFPLAVVSSRSEPTNNTVWSRWSCWPSAKSCLLAPLFLFSCSSGARWNVSFWATFRLAALLVYTTDTSVEIKVEAPVSQPATTTTITTNKYHDEKVFCLSWRYHSIGYNSSWVAYLII